MYICNVIFVCNIYLMIASKADIRTDMIMKTHKLLWKNLLAKQKSGLSGVFPNSGSLVLLRTVLAY